MRSARPAEGNRDCRTQGEDGSSTGCTPRCAYGWTTAPHDAPPASRRPFPRCAISIPSPHSPYDYDLLFQRVRAHIGEILEVAIHVFYHRILIERDRQLLQRSANARRGGIAVLEEGEDFVARLFNISFVTQSMQQGTARNSPYRPETPDERGGRDRPFCSVPNCRAPLPRAVGVFSALLRFCFTIRTLSE